MFLSVTFSKPVSNISEVLGKPYEKIKIKIENSSGNICYFAEMFTRTQVFHKRFTEEELQAFVEQHAGKTFKSCIQRTGTEEITVLANKKGKITTLRRKVPVAAVYDKNSELLNGGRTGGNSDGINFISGKKEKAYILKEGNPVPFLVLLGIMNSNGKVVAAKYDKFRQINRYLEFINDILPELEKEIVTIKDDNQRLYKRPLRIVDFGCGKSYLTFAAHYFLTQVKGFPCQIEGLDLKEEVINYCNELTQKLGLENLVFRTGNISDYSREESPDLVITLHACDTATDFALKYAVEKKARAILSVPCCQHQINQQLGKEHDQIFEPLLKWGIIKEKFSSLVTDALRGQWLETQGYKVQMLEFIDMEHTPKNILIRAVKNPAAEKSDKKNTSGNPALISALKINPEIWK